MAAASSGSPAGLFGTHPKRLSSGSRGSAALGRLFGSGGVGGLFGMGSGGGKPSGGGGGGGGGQFMRIVWRMYALLLVVALYQFFTGSHFRSGHDRSHGRSLAGGSSGSSSGSGSTFRSALGRRQRYAYITLLCDDVMAEAAMVMVHSVRRTGTPHDIVILTMNVSNRTLNALRALGAKIEPIITPVPYPFAITADRLAINKPCRYSKLLMWNLVQYSKLIYLDGDLLILRNIDELFQRPQLAAAPDTLPPDKFNSGLMVVEPSRAMFRDMLTKVKTLLSPNVGDQGFLNSYFADWYKQGPEHHIDYTYNALVRISVSPGWKQFIEPQLKVLHFSGNTKPWNMMVDKQFPTTREFDHRWWEVYDSMYKVLHRKALEEAAAEQGVVADVMDDGNGNSNSSSSSTTTTSNTTSSKSNITTTPPPQLAEQCRRDYMAYTRGHLVPDKVSVVINCFDRFDLLAYFLKRYSQFDFIHKIYVVWGNTHITPFLPADVRNLTTPIEIIYTGIDSLNDRFKPIKSLETEAVLMCDDDIEVHPTALRVAFERWQEDKYRLVGFFPRAHYREANGPRKGQLSYVLSPRQEYSIVLTKMFYMHGDYLRAYTCIVPQRVREYIDEHKNCEDITMNFVVTQLSGLPPLLMEDPTKLDYGTSSGLSSRGSHDFSRSVCMEDIAVMLGYSSLRNTTEVVTYFERDKMVKVVRRRRLSKAAHMVFQPIFDVFERTSSRQFMKTLTFHDELTTTEMAVVPNEAVNHHILCIKGNNEADLEDTSRNQYTLLDFASVPPDAGHLSGTTFIVHNSAGFHMRFTLLHIVSSFAIWRRRHGCFGPARLLLFQDGAIVSEMSLWASMLFKSVLGPGAAPPFKPPDDATPQCMERAVVVRQRDTFNTDECSVEAQEVRRVVRAYCRSVEPPEAELRVWDDEAANAQVAFVGDADNWAGMPWFNFSVAKNWIQPECAVFGMSCQVVFVPRGDFCAVKVLALSNADIVIGPWADRAMDSIIFLRPGTAVLELYPDNAHEDDLKMAKSEAACLELAYDQMKRTAGMRELLTWVAKQLEVLGRRTGRGKDDDQYHSFLETCVTRNLRF